MIDTLATQEQTLKDLDSRLEFIEALHSNSHMKNHDLLEIVRDLEFQIFKLRKLLASNTQDHKHILNILKSLDEAESGIKSYTSSLSRKVVTLEERKSNGIKSKSKYTTYI